MSHIYLVGFMGAGKTTVGARVAERISLPFVDLDEMIVEVAGMPITKIFEEQGEEAFRGIEQEVLERVSAEPRKVIACGGGIVVRDRNRAILRATGTVVYLRVEPERALARIGGADTRPLLSGGGGVTAATALLDAREALYAAVSDHVVDTSASSIEQVVDRVVELIGMDGAA